MDTTTPLAKRTLTLWLTVFLLACLAFALDHNMSSNEAVYLPKAKHFADPNYMPGDWILNQSVPYQYAFDSVMAPLTLTLPLVWVSILGRIIGYAVLSIGLARIARKFDMDVWAVALAGGVFVLLGQSISGGEWVFGQIEGKVLAWAALFLGLDALMDSKLKRSALFFGVGTSFHVLVGGWGTLALAGIVLVERMGGWRDRIRAAAIWCVAASFGIFAVVKSLAEPAARSTVLSAALSEVERAASATVDTAWLYVYFRNPHHLDAFASGFFTLAILTAPVGLWSLARDARKGRLPKERVILARFVLATTIPFTIGLLARLAPGGEHFLQYYPFRVGAVLFVLFGVVPGLGELLRLAGAAPLKWVVRLAAAGVLVAVCVMFVGQVRRLQQYPMGGISSRATYDACLWVREHAPEPWPATARHVAVPGCEHAPAGDVILAPPGLSEAAYMMNRSVVVAFKAAPAAKAPFAEWYDRLVQMNGGVTPVARGFEAAKEIDRNFNDLSA
jgi:hypothetical protein